MGSTRRTFLFSCFTCLFALAAPMMMSSQAHAKAPSNVVKLEGTLVAKNVAAGSLSIRKTGGAVVVVTVPSTAKVERNGVKTTIASFKLKDFVQTRSVNGIVVKAEAVGP